MATTTPNLGLTKPTVGADADAWGGQLNASLDTLDVKVLDKTTGGTINGPISVTNLSYSGSLTGGTGVINIGSGQVYKDAAGNVGIGTATPGQKLHVVGNIRTTNSLLESTGTNVNFGTITGGALAFLAGNGAEVGRFDSAGNLGIATIPPAATVPGIFFGAVGNAVAGTSSLLLLGNAYIDGANLRYRTSKFATQYELENQNGAHKWYTAPSGTAGAPINFRQDMTLTQGGNLLVGTTVDSDARLSVRGNTASLSNAGAVDVYYSIGVDNIAAGAVGFNNTGTINIYGAPSGSYYFGTNQLNQPLVFTTQAAERARITSAGNLRPGADNAYSLGEPSFRWSVVYAATGTINTSDVRAKLDFAPTFGLDFINALEPVSYRYKSGKTVIDQVEDGVEEVPAVLDEQGNEVTPATTKPKFKSVERVVEGIRRHHGLKAQQVKSVLDTLGVDFAGWVMDDPSDPESQQGLRYDQFIAPLIKAVQELSARVAELESRA